MNEQMTIPNILTISRMLLVPLIAWQLIAGNYTISLILFGYAGISDALDGFIARKFNQMSYLGSILDPAADKLLVVIMFFTAAYQNLIPFWLAAVVIGRDLIIVSGVIFWFFNMGSIAMEPSVPSKINMFVQVAVLVIIIMKGAGYIPASYLTRFLYLVSAVAAGFSGIQYVIIWAGRYAEKKRLSL